MYSYTVNINHSASSLLLDYKHAKIYFFKQKFINMVRPKDQLGNWFKSNIQMFSCKFNTIWAQQKCSACSMNVKFIDFVKKKSSSAAAIWANNDLNFVVTVRISWRFFDRCQNCPTISILCIALFLIFVSVILQIWSKANHRRATRHS